MKFCEVPNAKPNKTRLTFISQAILNFTTLTIATFIAKYNPILNILSCVLFEPVPILYLTYWSCNQIVYIFEDSALFALLSLEIGFTFAYSCRNFLHMKTQFDFV